MPMNNEDMQKYKGVYDNLKAPEQWKTNIKALMREELAKNNTPTENADSTQIYRMDFEDNQSVVDIGSKQKLSMRYRMLLTAGGIAAAIILVIVVNLMNGPRFVTPMKDGEIQSVVALKDTNLYFEIQDMEETDSSVLAGTGGDQNEINFEIDGETGEIVTSGKSDDAGTTPSYIKGIPVYLTITATDEGYRFTASYEKDGRDCEITRVGITQKEFIQLLYKEM